MLQLARLMEERMAECDIVFSERRVAQMTEEDSFDFGLRTFDFGV